MICCFSLNYYFKELDGFGFFSFIPVDNHDAMNDVEESRGRKLLR